MKHWVTIGSFLVVFFLSLFLWVHIGKTDNTINMNDIGSIQDAMNKLTSQLNQSVNATKPLVEQVNSMQQQMNQIKSQVAGIQTDVIAKQKIIDTSYQNLSIKEKALNQTIRDFYIKSTYNSPILILLSSQNAAQLTQVLAYQQAATNQDKAIITNLALSITDLEQRKKALEAEKIQLVALQANLDDQSTKLNKIIQGAQAYQASLTSQIAQLSSRQQDLLAQKLASLNIPQTAYAGLGGGCASDINPFKSPGFNPAFGFFTYGVPNRIGLNQYGAKGRAEAGQSYNTILSAYYQNFQITTVDANTNITVNGTNDYGQGFVSQQMHLDDYVKHLYEMPTSWSMEALKAQAIAARSYVMAYTNNGANPICPSQSCQEVKQEVNDNNWQTAVNATAGQVMESGGQPIKAWFSSTHGGYVFTSSDIGWSGTPYTKESQDANGSINNFSDLLSNAYDKDSPWFYCDWGSRASYNHTAWLQPSEVADISNVIALVQTDASVKEHLYQTDKPNPAGTDTWDAGRVKQELQNRNITPFNTISSISVNVDFGKGLVTSVTVNGDTGNKNFPGDFFKTYFDLRAPANIQIVGPLYNI
jgi:SpoIID/LytB domain protein